METIVLVLMVLVFLNTWIKLTFLKWWQVAVVTAACSIFVGMTWEWAIQQSRNEIQAWLANQPLMLDVSVVLTIEVFWQIAYCILSGKMLYGEPMRRRTIWIYRILRFFPGILVFPVLFYALVQTIYAFPGVDFAIIAWTLAGVIGIIMPTGAWGLRWLIPEKDLRLEVLFLLSTLILILGVVATVNGTTTFHGSDPIEWLALATFFILAVVCGIIGLLRYNKTTKD